MQWENLTSPQFEAAVKDCGGVCIVPLGVIEKHASHLPLGTDVFIGREVARRAAELEAAIVFPPYYFTQIYEARHTPGTIGIDSRVMGDLLQSVCDEIGRNGLKKIILLNAHGGNRHFLPHFVMLQLERPKDYAVYLPSPGVWAQDNEFFKQWIEMRESTNRDEHAGESETSKVLAICPQLVDKSRLPAGDGLPLERLSTLRDLNVQTAIEWYADFPTHYAGEGEFGTAEKGNFILDYMAQRLAAIIRVVKRDQTTLALQREFFEKLGREPKN